MVKFSFPSGPCLPSFCYFMLPVVFRVLFNSVHAPYHLHYPLTPLHLHYALCTSRTAAWPSPYTPSIRNSGTFVMYTLCAVNIRYRYLYSSGFPHLRFLRNEAGVQLADNMWLYLMCVSVFRSPPRTASDCSSVRLCCHAFWSPPDLTDVHFVQESSSQGFYQSNDLYSPKVSQARPISDISYP